MVTNKCRQLIQNHNMTPQDKDKKQTAENKNSKRTDDASILGLEVPDDAKANLLKIQL